MIVVNWAPCGHCRQFLSELYNSVRSAQSDQFAVTFLFSECPFVISFLKCTFQARYLWSMFNLLTTS